MISGILPRSVLGLLLFVICMNELAVDICSTISKFADDTNTGGVVDGVERCLRQPGDINISVKWAKKVAD